MLGLVDESKLSFEKFNLRTLTNATSNSVDAVDGAVERVWLYCLENNHKKKKKKKRLGEGRKEEGVMRNRPSSLRDRTNGDRGPYQGGRKTASLCKMRGYVHTCYVILFIFLNFFISCKTLQKFNQINFQHFSNVAPTKSILNLNFFQNPKYFLKFYQVDFCLSNRQRLNRVLFYRFYHTLNYIIKNHIFINYILKLLLLPPI
jgi:hypothetical protein